MKEIRIDRRLLVTLRKLAATDRRELGGAIASAQAVFGSPHLHTGVGVRKLKGRWYEVRAGLEWRLTFREGDDCLSFEFWGDHDDVQRLLKTMK